MGSGVYRLTRFATFLFLPVWASPQSAPDQSPPEEAKVHVALRVASESRSFRIGELIPLEMVFTADNTANYSVITIGSDRDGGRVDSDRFLLSPITGFSDPLQP